MKLKQLKSFISESSTFNGFVFSGMYDMDSNTFLNLLEHYLSTGENLLDDYSNVVYIDWDNSENRIIDNDEYLSMITSLGKIIRKGLFVDKRSELNEKVRRWFHNKYKQDNLIIEKRRQRACSYTAKKQTREYVFSKYGKICLRCGSTDNISIDHIIPVSKGGDDVYDNLQPLCKSCNSWKSDKEIDFRI